MFARSPNSKFEGHRGEREEQCQGGSDLKPTCNQSTLNQISKHHKSQHIRIEIQLQSNISAQDISLKHAEFKVLETALLGFARAVVRYRRFLHERADCYAGFEQTTHRRSTTLSDAFQVDGHFFDVFGQHFFGELLRRLLVGHSARFCAAFETRATARPLDLSVAARITHIVQSVVGRDVEVQNETVGRQRGDIARAVRQRIEFRSCCCLCRLCLCCAVSCWRCFGLGQRFQICEHDANQNM